MPKNQWDPIADMWIHGSETGQDIHRDFMNTPSFLKALPEWTSGRTAIDIGCGEGTNTRAMAGLGYKMTGADLCGRFIEYAKQKEAEKSQGIAYHLADATILPFKDCTFDLAVAFMSFMDMENPDKALKEAFRVVKPGGFFQFSIVHPCFTPPHSRWLRDSEGHTYAREVGKYFERGGRPMSFSRDSSKGFSIIQQHWPISDWLNMIAGSGFILETAVEPMPDPETIRRCPHMEHTLTVPDIIIFRLRKPDTKKS